nr:MAG TPA: hypothetical protein [Caudoviricetes sp.]
MRMPWQVKLKHLIQVILMIIMQQIINLQKKVKQLLRLFRRELKPQI